MTDTKTTDQKIIQQFAIGDTLIPVLQLAVEIRLPLLLSGDSGIGKSEFVHQLAAAMGRRVAVLNMPLFESAGELLGLPVLDGGVTRYARPAMLPEGPGWLVLIEEATRAAPHVTAAFYEFLTSRRIGDYELPPDCAIVACMNPPGPEYDGHAFDRAMSDRFMRVEVVANRDAWLPWAVDHGVHRAILDAVRDDMRLFLLASPRSWFRASRLLQAAEHKGMGRLLIERVLALELASFEAAHAVVRYLDGCDEGRSIVPAEVLGHYARDPRLGRRLGELLAGGRTDTIEKLVFGVELLLTGDALAGLMVAGGFDLVALEKFAGDIPGDRAAQLLSAFAHNPAAGDALDVDPQQALLGYRESALCTLVGKWRKAGLVHRLRAVATRIASHLVELDRQGRTQQLRGTPPVLHSLDLACRHLEEHAEPLRTELLRLGLLPQTDEVAS